MLRLLLMSLVFTLVSLAAFSGPQPAQATCSCDTSVFSTTPTMTGIGPSCYDAQINLLGSLKTYSNSVCGTLSCNLVVTTTVACRAYSGGYWVEGYATFNCRSC